MLAEVLLASLVLLVSCLIVADVTNSLSNTVHEQAAETAAGSGNTVDERTGANGTVALLRKIFFRLGPENLGVRPSLFLLAGHTDRRRRRARRPPHRFLGDRR